MDRKVLKEYKSNKDWLNKRYDKIKEEYESIQKLTSDFSRNSTHGSSEIYDKMADNLVALLDLKKETLDYAINLEKELHKIDNLLLKIEQPYRNILTFIYVNGESLAEVADDMHYNYEYMCRQHGKALRLWDKM